MMFVRNKMVNYDQNGLFGIKTLFFSPQCFVHVEDDENSFTWTGPGKGRVVEMNARRGALENHYDIGDELGRGTQGVTYHVVEHFTGKIQ